MSTNSTHMNLNAATLQLVTLQLSYSTADIERNIFYKPEHKPIITPSESPGKATLLVVHGEMFALEENISPQPSTPLTEESGLFRIIRLAEQT